MVMALQGPTQDQMLSRKLTWILREWERLFFSNWFSGSMMVSMTQTRLMGLPDYDYIDPPNIPKPPQLIGIYGIFQDPQGVVNGHPLTSKGLSIDTP